MMPTTSAITVTGYSHVAMAVDDLDAALEFYCGTLGFEQLRRPDLGPGAWLRKGTADVHLGVVDDISRHRGSGHIALHVPAAEFADAMAELKARGVTFTSGPSSRVDFGTTVRAAFITDPAGNGIEFTDVDPG